MTRRNRTLLAAAALAAAGLAAAALAAHVPPAVSTTHMQCALAALSAGRLDEAQKQARRLATDPHAPHGRAWAVAAMAHQRNGRPAEALEAHQAFLTSCTSTRLRTYTLAQMERCRAAMGPAVVLEPPSRRLTVERLRALARVEEGVSIESTDHFVIRARNPELAKLLAVEAERALARICHGLLGGQSYPHAVDVYVWPTPKAFRAHATAAPDWAGASFTLAAGEALMTRRIDLTQLDAGGRLNSELLGRMLPHELCHLVLREFFGDAHCPLFLDEGLAMLAEAADQNQRVRLAGAVLVGEGALPLPNLLACRRRDIRRPEVFYAEALSFTRYLRDRITARQFRAFLEHLKHGCTVADALQRALCVAPDRQFLPRLAAAWEDWAITETQFLRALDEDA